MILPAVGLSNVLQCSAEENRQKRMFPEITSISGNIFVDLSLILNDFRFSESRNRNCNGGRSGSHSGKRLLGGDFSGAASG
jgi:ribulose 1,5-bisphosphate carboxylase large subunit-like protein